STSELNRAKQWMAAFYERAYNERDKTESGSFAQECLNYFLEDEPTPGIAYEYALVQQVLPGITASDTSAMAQSLLADASRVILAVSPQKPDIRIPTDVELQAALATAERTAVTAWNDTTMTRELMERQLQARVANRDQAPGQVFGERLQQVNTSNHYTAQPLTPDRVAALDREKMSGFYHARFSNAADFTFFMVGAFKLEDAIPLLAQYVGSLPSTGRSASQFKDLAIHFPESVQRVR